MLTSIAAALALATDGLVACVALAAFGVTSNRPRHLAMAFGMCDGIATMLAPARPSVVLVIIMAFISANALTWRTDWRRLVYALPLYCGIDNLLTPAGDASVLNTLLVAVTSTALAGFGLYVGRRLREMFLAFALRA